MIFGNICQIVRKRCQMMKQIRKKAHLEEKYLVLGGFCPKNMVKEQFFCALRALKILILLNLAQKSLSCNPPPGAFGRIFTHGLRLRPQTKVQQRTKMRSLRKRPRVKLRLTKGTSVSSKDATSLTRRKPIDTLIRRRLMVYSDQEQPRSKDCL